MLRLARVDDVPRLFALSAAAGWNQTAQDWARFLELAPEGCAVIEDGGAIVASGGAIGFDWLAWIGMVLTLPEHRGRGHARRVMEHLVSSVDGVARCVKLDATEMGRPLYLKLGFTDECAVERWSRAAAPFAALETETLKETPPPDNWDFDCWVNGADRSGLLARLAAGGECASIAGGGYALGRPGRASCYLGPCAAASPEAARALIGWYIARHAAEEISWDLLPDSNPAAAGLAREFGFAPRRRLVRMRRGNRAWLASVLVTLSDVPPALRDWLPREVPFGQLVADLDRRTAARVEEGERDHLVHYVLQSRRFTAQVAIEPALSAREFAASGAISATVESRFADFLRARASGDERLAHFLRLSPTLDSLRADYARVMRFLHEKEFSGRDPAPLYRQRGHSTDSELEAGYAVAQGLEVLRALRPGLRIETALIAGPGADLAPRMGLREDAPPSSYQPWTVAASLIALGHPARNVHSVDVNERVVAILRAARPPALRIVARDPAYNRWARSLRFDGVARRITAEKLNLVTERLERRFDLIVATNILLYFDRAELALALTNLAAMLRPGGCLLHNDRRPEIDEAARALGLAALQARTLQLDDGLFDSFALYERR
ncbi:MAG: GNAT family N-acetyltransferase [Bryobacteraceae bacterium]